MIKRPADNPVEPAEDAVETDFSVPADADLRPSPSDDDPSEDSE